MYRRFFLYFLLLTFSLQIYSQGEINDEDQIFYRDEKSLGLMLTTKGIGLNLSYGKYINAYKKTLYQLDITEIKHPKEIKITFDQPFESSPSFVYGKLNRFFNIRTGIGLQKEIYRKIDKGGVSIRNYFTGGLNIGLEKPVYYIVLEYSSSQNQVQKKRKFNTAPDASNNIERYASFFDGFDELKVTPGAFAKYAFTFEYGKNDDIIHAIEGGGIIDIFPRPIHLMAHNNNDFIFISMYISYRFGKVVDSRFKNKKNKVDRLILQ